MKCEEHPSSPISLKCIKCNEFICEKCSYNHNSPKHEVETLPEIIDSAKQKIEKQIRKINDKISDLNCVSDYEMGEQIIQGCLQEIINFTHSLFRQLKDSYKKVCDSLWKNENTLKLQDLHKKKQNLSGWKKILKKTPSKVVEFEMEEVYQMNKIDSDDELMEQSREQIWVQNVPKISFNEIALRRLNENIGQILSISRIPGKKEDKGKIKSAEPYQSVCKFLQATNSLYQYVVHDPEADDQLSLRKMTFRQFISPMRSVSVNLGAAIYSIGGHTKEKKPSKQIWIYERSYNVMRVLCLLKRGRVGHTVCEYNDKIYIFGGKDGESMEEFDVKKKKTQEISIYENTIIGGSSCTVNNSMYIFGGRLQNQKQNKKIIKFDFLQREWETFQCLNYETYPSVICPIVLPMNSSQVLILGGYRQYDQQSYPNNYIQVYNVKCNYISTIGKGQLIYPIQGNGNNMKIKENKVIGIAELKKQRNSHGPNVPVLFEYSIKQDKMQISTIL